MQDVKIIRGNHQYQRDMAERLVDSLGRDEAIELCVQNEWSGVLDAILSIRLGRTPVPISIREQKSPERRTAYGRIAESSNHGRKRKSAASK